MKTDAQVTYFARHELAGPSERREGRKLGKILDKGYRVLTRDGDRFEISTLDWEPSFEGRSLEFQKVREIIEDRLGRKGLNITIS